ncbi:DUF2975 domain-containing protein [Cryobacterium sp. BB736]|uniref:DUF2975 domain-containing protein n=1 Tax=Cryobacterium sp. BB736 TaxID=2746963 RepID=UPI001873943F|nr:DUF2975 domain-containing protein [Cryobacterium sp. BB736]
MHRYLVAAIRVVIATLILAGYICQVSIIPLALGVAQYFPELAYLALPYAVLVIAWIACAQLGLVATWALLPMFRTHEILAKRALRWVNVIVGSAIVGTVLAVGTSIHLFGIVGQGNPPSVLGLGTATVLGVVVLIVMFTVRARLRIAADSATRGQRSAVPFGP